MKTVKYDVWSLDVWGNEQDGFDVNDRSCFARAVEFPTTHKIYNQGTPQEFSDDWPTDRQIMQTLKEIGFIKKSCRLSMLNIDGEHGFTLFIEETKNGFPVCQLEFVEFCSDTTFDIAQDDKSGKFFIVDKTGKEIAGPFETDNAAEIALKTIKED